MLDQELLQSAFNTALQDPDLQAALGSIDGDGVEAPQELADAVSLAADEIELAAAAELKALAAAAEELAQAELTATELALVASPELSEPLGAVREQIAELQAEQDRLVAHESRERTRINGLRAETAVLQARIAAGLAQPHENELERATTRRRILSRTKRRAPEKVADRQELEYAREMARLQELKKGIANVVTAKKRIQLQEATLEAQVARHALANDDPSPPLEAARARLAAARSRAERALVERAILPLWRSWINENRRNRYGLDLTGATASGLAELPNPDHLIDTSSQERLKRLLRQLPGGSIGISGPRGAGKTTLIRAFCGPDRSAAAPQAANLAVMVAAPVKFAPLEFVLHVLEQACRAALPPGVRIDPLQRSEPDQRAAALRVFKAAARVCGALGIIAAVVGTFLVARGVDHERLSETADRLLLAGAVAGATILSLLLRSPLRSQPRSILVFASTSVYAAVAVMATSELGAWGLPEWAAIAVAALAGVVVGIESRSSPRRAAALWRGSGALGLAAAGVVVLAAALDHRTTRTFATGALLLLGVIAAIPLVVLAGQQSMRWAGQHLPRRGAGPIPFEAQLLRIAQSALRDATHVIGLVIAPLALGLMVLGWFRHTPSTGVVVGGALAAAGAIIASRTRRALRTANYELERHARRDQDDETMASERPLDEDDGQPVFELAAVEDEVHPFRDDAVGELVADEMQRELLAQNEPIDSSNESVSTAPDRLAPLRVIARDNLRRIKYPQAFKSDWARKVSIPGSLKLPIGAEASASGGRSSTDQPISLPEAIAMLREYLASAAEMAGGFIIGIDELDKIGSPEEAERFLNEIKAILGIRGCYFLISVSEDAVASFERRGMPFRDVLDSTFDDVIRVDHFTLASTEALLNGRTLDMSLPFIALCHSIAGGLPRDVIRITRRLFDLHDTNTTGALGTLCHELVRTELKAKRDGTTTAVGHLRHEADTAATLGWLAQSAALNPTMRGLIAGLASSPAEANADAAARSVTRLSHEFTAYWYLSATLVEFFSDDRTAADFKRAEQSDGPDGIEQLAWARQAFAVDPALVWERVSDFREAWGLSLPQRTGAAHTSRGIDENEASHERPSDRPRVAH